MEVSMRTTRFWPLAVLGLFAASVPGGVLHAQNDETRPNGPHYNLNIIGMSKEKTADMTGNSGHRIFVRLGERKPADPVKTRISLRQGGEGEFQVIDADGTDGAAIFQLPAPGTYSVWVRPRGRPGGEAKMTTCAEDPTVEEPTYDDVVCSTANVVQVRTRGGGKFTNVTDELTTILLVEGSEVSLACDGETQVSLFNEGYFWDYDNNGLRLLQVRFYYED
jgi:hypothetical protein